MTKWLFREAPGVGDNRFVRWRRAGVWSRTVDALAAAHDAAIQVIGTSVVRVLCSEPQAVHGTVTGGLTSKIHDRVDTHALPVRLAVTPGEAHDNRLAGRLSSRLKAGSILLAARDYDADWIRELAIKRGAWPSPSSAIARGKRSRLLGA